MEDQGEGKNLPSSAIPLAGHARTASIKKRMKVKLRKDYTLIPQDFFGFPASPLQRRKLSRSRRRLLLKPTSSSLSNCAMTLREGEMNLVIRERDPFNRALDALRQRLRAGAFVEGEALTIVDLARELDLSATPVREALSRLAGEGLIEDRRGRGYFGWRLDALDLAELYDLSALHVGAALNALAGGAPPASPVALALLIEQLRDTLPEPDAAAAGAELLFGTLVLAGGGRTLVACHATLADRLGPARRVEVQVLGKVFEELMTLSVASDAGDWPAVIAMADAYHARRRAAAGSTVAAMRRVRAFSAQ
jgi:DNA-binding transcriptional ArsR family regulator